MRLSCLIPARGGSKRLPRKNVIDFLGRPIIAYTIEAAQACGLFGSVTVSTEDAEIAEIAQRHGATVAFRSETLAGDTARIVDVCLDYLHNQEAVSRLPDVLCCLLATAPLRGAEDIRAVCERVTSGQCDFSMAVTTYDLPPCQALRDDGSGRLVPMWPELASRRSQELPALCVDNGSTYCVSVSAFREQKTFYGARLGGYPMPRERSVDIDEQADLDLALYWAKKARA
jgi:CMP-N-acetylneuraminic acid synthetase